MAFTSYATEAQGDTYMTAYRLTTSVWTAASSANIVKALAQATMMIDRLNFIGELEDEDQDNQFPRGDDTTVPVDIQYACIELAYSLLDGVDPEMEYNNTQMDGMGYSSVRTTYNRQTIPEHIAAGIPSIAAWRFLKPYLRSGLSLRLERDS